MDVMDPELRTSVEERAGSDSLSEPNIAATALEPDLNDPRLYLNRELSWLEFNQRVLEEAFDPRNPLLERVKFLAITASNLDEFYAKRVGWLKRSIDADPRTRTVDDLSVSEQLTMVTERCHSMQRDMERCWSDILAPELTVNGIRILPFAELDGEPGASEDRRSTQFWRHRCGADHYRDDHCADPHAGTGFQRIYQSAGCHAFHGVLGCGAFAHDPHAGFAYIDGQCAVPNVPRQ